MGRNFGKGGEGIGSRGSERRTSRIVRLSRGYLGLGKGSAGRSMLTVEVRRDEVEEK